MRANSDLNKTKMGTQREKTKDEKQLEKPAVTNCPLCPGVTHTHTHTLLYTQRTLFPCTRYLTWEGSPGASFSLHRCSEMLYAKTEEK